MTTWLDQFWNLAQEPQTVVVLDVVAVLLVVLYYQRKLVLFVFKSLRRNLLRTALTSIAVMVMVLAVTMIWSVLWFIDRATSEKASNLKAIVTERWQLPSQMPFSYAASLSEAGATKPDDVRPLDSMTWQFYGGTIDPANRTRENIVFFFGMEPAKLLSMMDDIDRVVPRELLDLRLKSGDLLELITDRKVPAVLPPGLNMTPEQLLRVRDDAVAKIGDENMQLAKAIKAMTNDPTKVIIGPERLAAMNKKVGERIKVYSMNYKDIDLEMEIVGTFPFWLTRYAQSAVMNRDYINNQLDDYKRKKGTPHPLANKTLNLVWLKVPDTNTFNQISGQITSSPLYSSPAVKVETASSGVASFLDAYRDLLGIFRWLFVPATLITMASVLAASISISVRERRTEMAVLKVLGFGPWKLLALVLGEALLLGCTSGLVSAGGAYLFFNYYLGGIKIPIAFFPAFVIPTDALWWGPLLGGLTALAGSIAPAWSARNVKVAEVFAKIA